MKLMLHSSLDDIVNFVVTAHLGKRCSKFVVLVLVQCSMSNVWTFPTFYREPSSIFPWDTLWVSTQTTTNTVCLPSMSALFVIEELECLPFFCNRRVVMSVLFVIEEFECLPYLQLKSLNVYSMYFKSLNVFQVFECLPYLYSGKLNSYLILHYDQLKGCFVQNGAEWYELRKVESGSFHIWLTWL